jgi:tetratricopeptide (TPR) repeat protein
VFGNLFKKRDLSQLQAEAEALFADARFGDAKLAFDRVAERAGKENAALAEQAEQRAAACCDAMAIARVAEAEQLFARGDVELAHEELRHALEVARGEQARAKATALARKFERVDAVEQAREAAPISDEERVVMITGSWEPLQAEELEGYGEPLLRAALALDHGDGARALELLTPLISDKASYLWLELARAHLALKQNQDAEQALRRFLSRIGPEEGDVTRLTAHRELAHIAHLRDDKEGAIAELEAAAEAMADDPRPLLDLGNYLRLIDRPAEAVEVLELCVLAFGEDEVEWPVTMELGLACAAAGDPKRATDLLEGVISGLLAKGVSDLPPPALVALAGLYEKAGNVARAADLFRTLTRGSDVANHAVYHLEAARLLDVLKLTDEAERMRDRARALAAEAKQAVDSETASA